MENYQYHIFSPYRVCPLGAHVDHQHGLVTGFAFNMGVDLWFNPVEDGRVSLKSLTFEGSVDFDVTKPTQVKEGNWGDYARGAKYALKKRFELKHGIEGIIKGSLPVGGLSSSAAVLTAYVMALAKANSISLTKMEIIKIASEAEREYIGLFINAAVFAINIPNISVIAYSKVYFKLVLRVLLCNGLFYNSFHLP